MASITVNLINNCDGTTWSASNDAILENGYYTLDDMLSQVTVDDTTVDITITVSPTSGNTIVAGSVNAIIRSYVYNDTTITQNSDQQFTGHSQDDGSYVITIDADSFPTDDTTDTYLIINGVGKTDSETTIDCAIDTTNSVSVLDDEGLETGEYIDLDGTLTNCISDFSGRTLLVVGRTYQINFHGLPKSLTDYETYYTFTGADAVIPYMEWTNEDAGISKLNSTNVSDQQYVLSDFIVGANTSNYYSKGTASLAGGDTPTPTPTPTAERYPFNNIYVPTVANLQALSEVVIIRDATTGTLVDIPSYITSLKKIYATIPTTRTGEIKVSNWSTGVKDVALLDDNILVLSCGSQSIPEKYNSIADYNDTIIEACLPFVGIETLDTEKVMNKTITIAYHIDCITGDAICIITDENDISLYEFSCNISQDVPYLNEMLNGGNFNFMSGVPASLNLTPYIIIRRTKSSELDNRNNNYKRDLISNFTGYNRFSDFTVDSKATIREQQEINSLLEGGIII